MPKKRGLTEEEEALRERLGSSLRQASSARGIKPQDLAVAGGVSLAHQYRIESGETTPDALYLFKVCRLMGVTMDSLFKAGGSQAEPAQTSASVNSGGLGNMTNHGNNAVQVQGSKNKVSTKHD